MEQIITEAIKKDTIIIGESSHGIHEFAWLKFELAKELLDSISFIVVEWDWSDCFEINRYVKHETDDYELHVSRFPEFLWDNEETENFIEYLREYNADNTSSMVGFYGLDMFGIKNSLDNLGFDRDICDNKQHVSSACKEYIERIDSRSLKVELNIKDIKNDNSLDAYVCAKIIVRSLKPTKELWDIRELHMFDVFQKLKRLYRGKGLILCHNTHAQSTKCIAKSVSSLATMIKGSKYIIGMVCFEGSILTADSWGSDIIKRKINKPDPDSFEYNVFTKYTEDVFILNKKELEKVPGNKYRALGAIVPSNSKYYYFEGSVSCSFDSVLCVRNVTPIRY